MLEAHGLLQLTMRSESYRRDAQILIQNNANKTAKSDGSSAGSGSGGIITSNSLSAKSAVTLPKGALDGPMKEFWQRAADKAAEYAPSADTVKKLQDASKSDNKEIAAQKMQAAKAKLQSLRLQAQLAAASGDTQQLKRLAQEVAAAAHDVASAAHDLAGGIADSLGGDSGGGDSGSVPLSTTGGDASESDAGSSDATASGGATAVAGEGDEVAVADSAAPESAAPSSAAGETGAKADAAATPVATAAAPQVGTGTGGTDSATSNRGISDDPLGDKLAAKPKDDANTPLYAQDPPQDGDKFAWGQKALNSLSTDANNALAQARGLIAFIASLARGKRKAGEGTDDDQFFNALQREVDDAQSQVNHDISTASQQLVADQTDAATQAITDQAGGDAGSSSVLGIDTVTITQVTTTAIFLDITA